MRPGLCETRCVTRRLQSREVTRVSDTFHDWASLTQQCTHQHRPWRRACGGASRELGEKARGPPALGKRRWRGRAEQSCLEGYGGGALPMRITWIGIGLEGSAAAYAAVTLVNCPPPLPRTASATFAAVPATRAGSRVTPGGCAMVVAACARGAQLPSQRTQQRPIWLSNGCTIPVVWSTTPLRTNMGQECKRCEVSAARARGSPLRDLQESGMRLGAHATPVNRKHVILQVLVYPHKQRPLEKGKNRRSHILRICARCARSWGTRAGCSSAARAAQTSDARRR